MVRHNGKRASPLRQAWLGCCIVALAPQTLAQITDPGLPISLDADSTDYDGKSSMLMFEGLRLTQGNIGVQADKGLASKLDFEDSVWQFSGNVVIDTESGHIECDDANLQFSGHQLTLASISGSPATFSLERAGAEGVTRAQAGRLDYDFTTGVVEFSDNAVITEGGNQISSDYLVYDIKEQRINAQSAGEGEPRVKIIYTPQSADTERAADPGDDGENHTAGEDPADEAEDPADEAVDPVQDPGDA